MPGFPAETVNAQQRDAFKCPHCKLVLRDAVQTESGVRFCVTCYKEIVSRDRAGSADGYYNDRAVRREVLKLLVKCRYHSPSGCSWTGKLQDWEKHCLECIYKSVECPNEGCEVVLPSSELEGHTDVCQYRKVSCEHCGESLTVHSLNEHHTETCERYPTECERCQAKIERSKLEEHQMHSCPQEQCLLCHAMVDRETTEEVHPTPPSPAGTGKRKIKGHQNRRLHLANPKATHRHVQMLAMEQQVVQRDLKALQAVIDKETREETSVQTTLNEWKTAQMEARTRLAIVEGIFEELKRTKEREMSQNRKGAALEAKLEQTLRDLGRQVTEQSEAISRQNAYISSLQQSIESLKGSSIDNAQVLAQLKKGRHMTNETRHMTYETQQSWAMGMSSESSLRVGKKVEELERQTSSMKVRVSELELQLQASLTSTHDGSLLWRIPDISSRRRDAINERVTSIYSPPFYSGRNGYKMCVRAYLNGDGTGYGTHLSLFFVLMKGEYDPLLRWPFENKVSLILIDQSHHKHIIQTFKPSHESVSFKRPDSDMNVASGCPTFAKLSVLDNGSYVKGDVMYVKCIVDTSKIFHP